MMRDTSNQSAGKIGAALIDIRHFGHRGVLFPKICLLRI